MEEIDWMGIDWVVLFTQQVMVTMMMVRMMMVVVVVSLPLPMMRRIGLVVVCVRAGDGGRWA